MRVKPVLTLDFYFLFFQSPSKYFLLSQKLIQTPHFKIDQITVSVLRTPWSYQFFWFSKYLIKWTVNIICYRSYAQYWRHFNSICIIKKSKSLPLFENFWLWGNLLLFLLCKFFFEFVAKLCKVKIMPYK